MPELNFSELLHTFSTRRLDLPALLATVADLEGLFDAAKLFLQDSLSRDKIDEADRTIQFVWAVANHTSEQEHQALAHWCSLIFFNDRDVKQALYHAEKTLDYYHQTEQTEKEGRILIGYAAQLSLLGRLAEAEQAMRRSIHCLKDRPDYRDWPIIYLNLAYIQVQQGNYTHALATAQQAENMALAFGEQRPAALPRYHRLRAKALINQGYAALFLGQLELADSVLRGAQALAETYGFSETAGRAAFNRARLAIKRGELFAALRLLHTASTAFETAQLQIDRATVAIEKARLYESLTMIRYARQEAELAAKAFAHAEISAESMEAHLLAVRLSFALGEPSKARALLIEAEKHLMKTPALLQALWRAYNAHPLLQKNPDQYRQALQATEQAALTLEQSGALSEALEVALIAAQLATALGLPATSQRLQQIAESASRAGLWALEQQAWLTLAQQQPARMAIQTLRHTADMVAHTRSHMPVEELKANLLTGHANLYTHLIEAQLKSRQPGAALTTVLEAKGGIWADLAAPADIQEQTSDWIRAKAVLAFWRDELRAASEVEYRILCQAKVQQAEAIAVETARQQSRLRKAQPLPTLAAIQAGLDVGTVALEYLVGTTHIWVCIIKAPQPPQWLRLGKRSEIQPLLERVALLLATVQHCQTPEQRWHIAQAQQPWIVQILRQLHTHLFAPLTPYLPITGPLIIAPDSYLFETPWNALYDGVGYLGQRYIISLVPSTVLLALRTPSRFPTTAARRIPRALGHIGNPPLHCVPAELAALQAAVPDLWIANPATSTDLNWPVAPRLLHIASHGRVNRTTPLLSYLELADGPFLLADVFNLDLHGTELVTLSACETGTTPTQGGVALALAGAFLCAGAATVLSSLWSVDDAATPILIADLYQQVVAGCPPALALQHAQQALCSAGYDHPFYWAAFQPLGRVI